MKHVFAILTIILAYTMTSGAAVVTRGPYLQSQSANRITICWRTDVPTTSEVVFGLQENQLSTPLSNPGTRVDHIVTLTGLQSSTRYFYRIKGIPASGAAIDVGGPQHFFKTSPAPGTATPTRFWVIGDSGYQTNYADIAFTNYKNLTASTGKTTDFFMMLGDNAYAYGTDSEYQGAVFNRYSSILKNTTLWSTIGNHDDTTAPAIPPAPYYSIFHFPTAAECGGITSGTERYYSFDHGNIHFICIDSNTYATVSDALGEPHGMADWLSDDLKSCNADWIIAYMHEGPYSKGSHDSDGELNLQLTRRFIVPLLEKYGVDLVFAGHSHSYERSRFMDGHYGSSSTWSPNTMVKQLGNGSEIGGSISDGSFVRAPYMTDGAYQKPAALGRAGTIYAVSGAASSSQAWTGGSAQLVNPTPHPAHLVSINTIGSMVIEINDHRLNGQYLDQQGAVRDDFTILKGATYTLHEAAPFTEAGVHGVSFPVTRTGSLAFTEQIPVEVDITSGTGSPPSQIIVEFAAGQSNALARFLPQPGSSSVRFNARLLPSSRPVADSVPRSVYRISGAPQPGQFSTSPATTWYASRFAAEPASTSVWESDNDGDGLSLLLEYALGGDANKDDSSLLPKGTIEDNFFVFRYNRPHGRTDLTYQILGSSDLTSWTSSVIPDSNDGPITAFGEPRKMAIPMESSSKFLRLKIALEY